MEVGKSRAGGDQNARHSKEIKEFLRNHTERKKGTLSNGREPRARPK